MITIPNEIKEPIYVKQAYDRGEQIEYRIRTIPENDTWYLLEEYPDWNWAILEYRIKPKQKYRPYNDAKEFLAAQKEHGMYLRLDINPTTCELPIRVLNDYISLTIIVENDMFKIFNINYEDLLKTYVWNDGTKCGIKEKD